MTDIWGNKHKTTLMERKIYCSVIDCEHHDKITLTVCNINHIHISLNNHEFELYGDNLAKTIKLKSMIRSPICFSYEKINQEK